MSRILSDGSDESRTYSSPIYESTNRYPALTVIATIYRLFAGLVAIIVVLSAVANIFVSEDDGLRAVIVSVVLIVAGGACFLFLWSSAEVIKLSIDIEGNTRRTAELLERATRKQ